VVGFIVTVIGSIAALAVIAWLGFQILPKNFPPHPEKTKEIGSLELPSDLPKPIQEYLEATFIKRAYKLESAVIWGRARFKMAGLWMPVRFRAHYLPGQDFYRYMEITWFGLPLLRGYDSYINGEGMLKMWGLRRISEMGEKINQSQNLTAWAEAMWMPSIFITNPKVRWEVVDNLTARLVVPFGEQEESLLVKFDRKTGLITQMSAQRYRNQEEEKTPWRVDCLRWKTFRTVKIPSPIALTWEDEGRPWALFSVEGIEYNVDVSDKISGKSYYLVESKVEEGEMRQRAIRYLGPKIPTEQEWKDIVKDINL
jgi:hypothetical protein